ncbi:hypothetical protein H0G86_004141 [Trichoderma simmonsii]|uniref:Uncharacterized protein n=1 Tax=Trichoderma simmonsii TaxID=1491479 RepID=A0A8G0LBP7_9HYPO|nr:hypothetical protein H0G86_004141 [Trichoderma simmonsii]
MPSFEKPKGPFDPSQLRAWSDNVEPQVRDLLWGDYWQRFNTIQIPIFGSDVYFENALHFAKLAKGQKEEFERMFEAENKRRQKLASKMFTVAMRAIDEDETYLCKNARDRVSELCQTGCYIDFLRLLIGISHDWDESAAQDSQSDGDTGDLSEETQDSADQIQDSDDEETHHETPWLGDDYYEAPEGLAPGEDLVLRHFSRIFGVSLSECMSASDDDVGPESDVSVSERENKENKAPHRQRKRKRDLSDDDVPTARSLRRKLMSGKIPDQKDFPLTPQGDIDWEAIDDELLFNNSMDEYDYDEYDYDEDDGDDDEEEDEEDDGDDEGDEEEDHDDGDQDNGEEEDGDDERNVPIKISFFL